MSLKIRRIFYWLGLVIGAGLFLIQIVIGIQPVLSNRQIIYSIWPLALAGPGMILLISMQMVNWGKFLKGSGYHIRMKELLKGYTLSFLPRYIPGSVWGYLSRGEWLHQRFQVPYQVVNLSSILDILVAIVSATMLIGLFTGLYSNVYSSLFPLFFVLVVALPIIIWLLIDRLIKLNGSIKFTKLKRLIPTKNIPMLIWLECITIFLGQWVVYGIVTLLILTSFYPKLEALRFLNIQSLTVTTFAFSLSWLVGFLIVFIPGGVGVREIVLTSVLISYFPISLPQAIGVAVFSRLLYSFAELFWIGVGFAASRSS